MNTVEFDEATERVVRAHAGVHEAIEQIAPLLVASKSPFNSVYTSKLRRVFQALLDLRTELD